MPRFVEGQDRHQVTLLPESLDDFIAEDNAVRVGVSTRATSSTTQIAINIDVLPASTLSFE